MTGITYQDLKGASQLLPGKQLSKTFFNNFQTPSQYGFQLNQESYPYCNEQITSYENMSKYLYGK